MGFEGRKGESDPVFCRFKIGLVLPNVETEGRFRAGGGGFLPLFYAAVYADDAAAAAAAADRLLQLFIRKVVSGFHDVYPP